MTPDFITLTKNIIIWFKCVYSSLGCHLSNTISVVACCSFRLLLDISKYVLKHEICFQTISNNSATSYLLFFFFNSLSQQFHHRCNTNQSNMSAPGIPLAQWCVGLHLQLLSQRLIFFYTAFCLSCVCHSCILKQHSKGFGDFPTIKLKSLSWLVFSSTIPFSRHFPFSQFSIGCIYQHGVAINMYLLMYLFKSAVYFLIICNSSSKSLCVLFLLHGNSSYSIFCKIIYSSDPPVVWSQIAVLLSN